MAYDVGMKDRSFAPYVWMLGGCLSFALMAQFATLLQARCDWRLVALARSGLVFLLALGLARLANARLVFWEPGVLWMRSIAGSLSMVCTFYAFAHLTSTEVLTLTNTFPIWVAVLSWPLLGRAPGLSVWLAAACGVAGVVLMQRPNLDARTGAQLAVLLALVAAVTSAVAMLGLHRLKNLHPWAVVAHFSGVATVIVMATWLSASAPGLSALTSPLIVALLFGVAGTATFGQFCLTRAFTSGQPARVSIVGLTQIVFALGLDAVFGRPALNLMTLLGIALVMAPTAWMMAERAAE